MSNKRVIYKVVSVTNQKFFSARMGQDGSEEALRLPYTIGEPTIPEVGLLYAFTNYRAANDFRNRFWGGLKILRCHGWVSKRPVVTTHFSNSLANIQELWKRLFANKAEDTDIGCAPKGSVLCTKILPLTEIN
jgi:hypothetical protein